jgi:ribonuclease HI
MTVVEMFADGACKGNPGPGGWGVLLQSGKAEKKLFGGEAQTTNNRMELTAVIEGLKSLKRPCTVNIHLDSQYVLKGITEWMAGWKARGWKTASKSAVKNEDLWRQLDQLVSQSGHDLHWHWIKGHSGHFGNEAADALANQGVETLLAAMAQ